MPQHDHDALGYSGSGNEEGPGGNVWAKKNRDDDYSSQAPNVAMNATAISLTGGGQPLNIPPQPYLGLYYCIALQGFFPPRN